MSSLNVTLWGTRGSIPCPGPNTVKYGGNTLCLEVRYGEANQLVIVDAGSGIRALGSQLMRQDLPKGPIKAKMFFSHTHWDHISGFPFFIPIFVPTTQLEIYGPVSFENESLAEVIGGQLQYRYFPVTMAELSAKITYNRLQETELELDGGLKLKTKYLNHPITCLGYRFEFEGKSIVTVFDHEPYRNLFAADPASPDYDADLVREGQEAADAENQRILNFMKDADIVLHDAQYSQKEYLKGKQGWGHSTFEWAVNAGHKAGVKKLVLIHHDPERTDAQIDELEASYQALIRGKSKMEVVFAREGMRL